MSILHRTPLIGRLGGPSRRNGEKSNGIPGGPKQSDSSSSKKTIGTTSTTDSTKQDPSTL